MTRTHQTTVMVVLALTVATAAHGQPATAIDAFAQRIQQAVATPGGEDNLILAAEMLSEARRGGDDAAIGALAATVLELTEKTEGGEQATAEALRLLADHVPAQRRSALERLVDVRQRLFTATRAQDERGPAGEALIRALLDAAEASANERDHAAAVTHYRRAIMVAASIDSPSRDEARRRMDEAAAAQQRGARVAMLEQRVKANLRDLDAARQLLRLHVIEADDPAAALPYAAAVAAQEPQWRANVPLAQKEIPQLSAAELAQLGEWYHGLSVAAPASAKRAMLRRAYRYYGYWLRDHGDQPARSTVELAQKQLGSQLQAIGEALPAIAQRPVDTGGPLVVEAPLPVHAMADDDNSLFRALRAPREARQQNTGWLDVLEVVSPQRDGVAGEWAAAGGAVQATSTGSLAYARLPVRMRGSYRLFVAFTPREGSGEIALVLPVGDSAVELKLPMDNPRRGGFAIGTGRDPGLTLEGLPILAGDATTMQIEVKVAEGQAELTAFLDDAPWSRWKGPVSALVLAPGRYQLFEPGTPLFAVEAADSEARLLVDLMELKLKITDGQVKVFGL